MCYEEIRNLKLLLEANLYEDSKLPNNDNNYYSIDPNKFLKWKQQILNILNSLGIENKNKNKNKFKNISTKLDSNTENKTILRNNYREAMELIKNIIEDLENIPQEFDFSIKKNNKIFNFKAKKFTPCNYRRFIKPYYEEINTEDIQIELNKKYNPNKKIENFTVLLFKPRQIADNIELIGENGYILTML